jgi:peroxiredoxin
VRRASLRAQKSEQLCAQVYRSHNKTATMGQQKIEKFKKVEGAIDPGAIEKVILQSGNFEKKLCLGERLKETVDKPLVIYIARRANCAVCQSGTYVFDQAKEKFDALGFEQIAVLASHVDHESFEQRLEKGTKLWIDDQKTLYEALGRGKLYRTSRLNLMKPSFFRMVMKSFKNMNQKFQLPEKPAINPFDAETLILGGVIVLCDGKVAFDYRQRLFEDMMTTDQIFEECAKLRPEKAKKLMEAQEAQKAQDAKKMEDAKEAEANQAEKAEAEQAEGAASQANEKSSPVTAN